MRLVSNTPDRIELRHSPWGPALVLGFLFLAAVSAVLGPLLDGRPIEGLPFVLPLLLIGLALRSGVRRIDVVGDASTRRLTVVTRSLAGRRRETYPLDRITGAELRVVRTSRVENDGRRMLVIALRDRPQGLPLRGPFDFSDPAPVAQALDRWLRAAR